MDTYAGIKDAVPGLSFRVQEHRVTKAATTGVTHGLITLHCEVQQRADFDMAVKHLDGFKLFGNIQVEFDAAVRTALDNQDDEIAGLVRELAETKEELARKTELLAKLERELGISSE